MYAENMLLSSRWTPFSSHGSNRKFAAAEGTHADGVGPFRDVLEKQIPQRNHRTRSRYVPSEDDVSRLPCRRQTCDGDGRIRSPVVGVPNRNEYVDSSHEQGRPECVVVHHQERIHVRAYRGCSAALGPGYSGQGRSDVARECQRPERRGSFFSRDGRVIKASFTMERCPLLPLQTLQPTGISFGAH